MSSRWLIKSSGSSPRCPSTSSASRVVLLPHAGGGASYYRRWARGVPESTQWWVVQYPGREDRLSEQLTSSWTDVVDSINAALLDSAPEPTVLFGHSMGAFLAFEVALRLEERGYPLRRLVVSGREGPARVPSSRPPTLDDAALLKSLSAHAGTSEEVLRDPEIRAMVLPVLHNDYAIVADYAPTTDRMLACRVDAVAGRDDPGLDPQDLAAWTDVTSGKFAAHRVDGGHFYADETQLHLARWLAGVDSLPPLDASH